MGKRRKSWTYDVGTSNKNSKWYIRCTHFYREAFPFFLSLLKLLQSSPSSFSSFAFTRRLSRNKKDREVEMWCAIRCGTTVSVILLLFVQILACLRVKQVSNVGLRMLMNDSHALVVVFHCYLHTVAFIRLSADSTYLCTCSTCN